MKLFACFAFLQQLFGKKREQGKETNTLDYEIEKDNKVDGISVDTKINYTDGEESSKKWFEDFEYSQKSKENESSEEEEIELILDNRYHFEYNIAETRESYIFAVNDLNNDTIVVLKTTPTEGRYIPNETAPNELKVLDALSGIDGVVKVLDAFQEGSQYCIVIQKQLCDIGSLLKKCPNETFTQKTAINVIHKVVEVLERCHGAGYLHCDIKPSSFLVSKKKSIVLSGFQLSLQYKKKYRDSWSFPEQRPSFRRDFQTVYSSQNQEINFKQDQTDDFMSLFFCFLDVLGYKGFKNLSYAQRWKFLKSPDMWVEKKDEKLIPLLQTLLGETNRYNSFNYNAIYTALNEIDPLCHYSLPLDVVENEDGYNLL